MIIHWVFLNIYNVVVLLNAKQHTKIKFLQHLVELKTKTFIDFSPVFSRTFNQICVYFVIYNYCLFNESFN